MRFCAILASATLMIGGLGIDGAAGAQSGGAQSDPAQSDPAPAPERKICRTYKVTGSLTRRQRVCMTARQWRELEDRTHQGLDEFGRSAAGGKECVLDQWGGCNVDVGQGNGPMSMPGLPPGAN